LGDGSAKRANAAEPLIATLDLEAALQSPTHATAAGYKAEVGDTAVGQSKGSQARTFLKGRNTGSVLMPLASTQARNAAAGQARRPTAAAGSATTHAGHGNLMDSVKTSPEERLSEEREVGAAILLRKAMIRN
jgi:hypothetical protein